MATTRRPAALFAVLLAGAIVVAPSAAATASTSGAPPAFAGMDATGRAVVPSGTDDFTFDSFDAAYLLDRDGSGESTLHTTENLVAEFPSSDQNRGIVRAIPAEYDGHPTQIHILSVTDGEGAKRTYDASYDSGFYTLKIGVPKGQFAHGRQSYRIEYTQQDVTRYFANTDDDEFYWDVNGTGWAQPFTEVSATVTVSPALASGLNGKTACYYGPEGSTQRCEITAVGSVFTATQPNLLAHQNLTIAIGFEPGTFAAASVNPLSYLSPSALVGAVVAILTLLFGLLAPLRWRAKGTGIVVAQYEPPAGVSALVAANIVGQTKRGFAASIVDLAVRGKLKIHVRKSGLFGTGHQFGVQPLDDSGLDAEDSSIYAALAFGSQEDGVVWLQKKDTTLGAFVLAVTKSVAADVLTRGLRTKPPRWAFVIALGLSVLASVLLVISTTNGTSDIATGFGVVAMIAAVLFAFIALARTGGARPLSHDGKLLEENLLGLKEYIQLAEADRLRMLQGVTTAERTQLPDGSEIVKIYEKLLPYATLFGLEKEWAGELGKYYDQNPPGWYDGGNVGAFNAGYFAGSIASFGSTVSSSYSGSASSSSSGGSGGGGGSGGAGGGGGGGGF